MTKPQHTSDMGGTLARCSHHDQVCPPGCTAGPAASTLALCQGHGNVSVCAGSCGDVMAGDGLGVAHSMRCLVARDPCR